MAVVGILAGNGFIQPALENLAVRQLAVKPLMILDKCHDSFAISVKQIALLWGGFGTEENTTIEADR